MVLCPLMYRMLGINALMGGGFQPVGPEWIRAYQEDFFRWGASMQYTPWGAFRRAEEHRWGLLVLWPKEKTMAATSWAAVRCRLLNSFRRHHYRRWLMLLCRALNFLRGAFAPGLASMNCRDLVHGSQVWMRPLPAQNSLVSHYAEP